MDPVNLNLIKLITNERLTSKVAYYGTNNMKKECVKIPPEKKAKKIEI